MYLQPKEHLALELTLQMGRVLETEQQAHAETTEKVERLIAAIERHRAQKRLLIVYCSAYTLLATLFALWGWLR